MKNNILNNGLQHTEEKHLSISDLKTGWIIVLGIIAVILSCTTCTYCTKYNNLSGITSHNDSIQNDEIAQKEATINELTHDNMSLVNNTK